MVSSSGGFYSERRSSVHQDNISPLSALPTPTKATNKNQKIVSSGCERGSGGVGLTQRALHNSIIRFFC